MLRSLGGCLRVSSLYGGAVGLADSCSDQIPRALPWAMLVRTFGAGDVERLPLGWGWLLRAHELFDGAGLVDFVAGGFEVEVAVVFDRVAVGVEEGGVPIADGFVTFGGVVGEADIAAGHVKVGLIAGEDDEGGFGSVAVVAFSVFGEIHDDGVVEHGSFSFGGGFEFFDDGGDLFHVTEADFFADFVSGDAAVAAVVAEFVDGDVVSFVSGHAFDGGGKLVDGVGDNIGEAGDEGRDEDVGHGLLLLGRAGVEAAFGVDGG